MKDSDPVQVSFPQRMVPSFQEWMKRERNKGWNVRCIRGEMAAARPSCLVAAIGTDFMPGVLESLKLTIDRTGEAGWDVTLFCVKNICIEPFRGLGAMRNWAAQEALAGGYDYLLTVDNDVLFRDASALARLLARGKLIVVPWLDQTPYKGDPPAEWDNVAEPLLEPDQGLLPIRWAAVSCVLYDTVVFRYAGQRLWTDAMVSNEEAFYFLMLRNLGMRLWQDTDTRVSLLRGPTPIWEVLGRPTPNPVQEGSQ